MGGQSADGQAARGDIVRGWEQVDGSITAWQFADAADELWDRAGPAGAL